MRPPAIHPESLSPQNLYSPGSLLPRPLKSFRPLTPAKKRPRAPNWYPNAPKWTTLKRSSHQKRSTEQREPQSASIDLVPQARTQAQSAACPRITTTTIAIPTRNLAKHNRFQANPRRHSLRFANKCIPTATIPRATQTPGIHPHPIRFRSP